MIPCLTASMFACTRCPVWQSYHLAPTWPFFLAAAKVTTARKQGPLSVRLTYEEKESKILEPPSLEGRHIAWRLPRSSALIGCHPAQRGRLHLRTTYKLIPTGQY